MDAAVDEATGSLAFTQKKREDEKFLKPLRSKLKSRYGIVLDFETKDDESQEKGWTRPFLLGFDDGDLFYSFRNDDEVMEYPWRLRHLLPGGLVDKFMRFITAHGDKYQSKACSFYAHNGGKFDNMFILGWLLKQQDEFEFEIAPVQSRIQRLDFWPRGQPKKHGYWSILDSLALLPMSLKKVGETFTPGDAEKMAMDLDLPEWTTGLAIKEGSRLLGWSRAELAKVLKEQALTVIGLVREHVGKKPPAPLQCPHVRTFVPTSAFETNVLGEESLKADPCPECKREADAETMLPLDGIGNLMEGDTVLIEGREPAVALRLAWANTVTFDVWEAYNALDCKVLRLGLERFHDLVENKLEGEVGMTAPATAMKLYRRRYQTKFIHRNAHFKECNGQCRHGFRSTIERGKKKGVSVAGCGRAGCDSTCHGCAHDWVRLGYYGGRTELFCEWGFDLRYYDVNSSYPASMLKDMPVGRMIVPKSTQLAVLRELAKTHVGFVECEVDIPRDCVLPPLPYRVPEGKRIVIKKPSGEEHVVPPGKLIFPTGKLYGVWDWEELKLLDHPLVKGKITRVVKSVWYERSPVFAEMVNDLYRYRQKHLKECFDRHGKPTCGEGQCNPFYNEGLSFCAKLMLNSLYGKFGMREERTGLVLVPEGAPWPDNAWPIDGEHETCRVWEQERLAHASYIIPQISAHITSLSRIILYTGMADVMMHGVCTNEACVDADGNRTRVHLGRPPLFAAREKPPTCDLCGHDILRGKLLYSDSVTGHRCVAVRDPHGRTKVLPIERLFEWHGGAKHKRPDGKQSASLDGWTALAVPVGGGKPDYFPIGEIVRHRSKKALHLVSTKEGQTEVTSDHGIMVAGEGKGYAPVTPQQFTAQGQKFVRVKPPMGRGKRVDLLAEVKQFTLTSETGMVSRFEALGYDAIGRTGAGHRDKHVRIRRYFERGSEHLHALLRGVAAFVAEGSASLSGTLAPQTASFDVTRACRNMLSISQKDQGWLRAVKRDIESFIDGIGLSDPFETAGASVIRSGAATPSFLFAALCGEGHSRNRRLPSFCMDLSREDFLVLWHKLVEGDGSVDVSGHRFMYGTQSSELASQLSYLLSMHGFDHSITYRPSKKFWTLRLRESKRRSRAVKHETRQDASAWVYDLEVVGAGTFVDAMGCVLLKNTDSIVCNIDLSPSMVNESILGMWKREKAKILLSGNFRLPKLYQLIAHEQTCKKPRCKGCKLYFHRPGCKSKKCKGCSVSEQRMKGIGSQAQTPEVYDAMIGGKTIRAERVAQHKEMLQKAMKMLDEGFTVTAHKPGKKTPKSFFHDPGDPAFDDDGRVKRSLRTVYDKRMLIENGDTIPIHIPG